MDGLEMVRQMRESDVLRGVPVIVVSTEGSASRLALLKDMGVTAYVRKPFTPEMLRDVVTGLTTEWPPEESADLIEEVFVRVLERFTFSYGEAVAVGELPEPEEKMLCAKMTFTGARGGLMVLAAPLEAARGMAANILSGESADVEVTEAADVLGEVLNMACGHLATGLEEREVIELSPPEVYALELDEWRQLARGAHAVGFMVDERPVLLAMGMR
jgi:CheY-specific phosphatase CheX